MNKKLIVAAVISLSSAVAFAQSAQTASTASTQSAAQGGSLLFAPVSDSTVRYATSSAFAPSLTSSNDTCMGSSSMGATGMSFGVALGSTWTDNNCLMLKNAREEWNMGEHSAAMALLCTNDDIRYSISVSGGVIDRRKDGATIRRGCPMTKSEWVAAGRPLIDPDTGQAVAAGSVVTPAPVAVAQVQRPVAMVDSQGVLTTFTPQMKTAEDIRAHAAIIKANAEMRAKSATK
jgi:hypothetical protein